MLRIIKRVDRYARYAAWHMVDQDHVKIGNIAVSERLIRQCPLVLEYWTHIPVMNCSAILQLISKLLMVERRAFKSKMANARSPKGHWARRGPFPTRSWGRKPVQEHFHAGVGLWEASVAVASTVSMTLADNSYIA